MKHLAFKIFLLFFLTAKIVLAQSTNKVDSLLSITQDQQSPDTLKVKALRKLFSHYLYNDQEKAYGYWSSAYELSKSIKWEKGIAACEGQKEKQIQIIPIPR